MVSSLLLKILQFYKLAMHHLAYPPSPQVHFDKFCLILISVLNGSVQPSCYIEADRGLFSYGLLLVVVNIAQNHGGRIHLPGL